MKRPLSPAPDAPSAAENAAAAAALSAANTLASCEPATGLLQWHTATCYLNTYDRFGNPQLGLFRVINELKGDVLKKTADLGGCLMHRFR